MQGFPKTAVQNYLLFDDVNPSDSSFVPDACNDPLSADNRCLALLAFNHDAESAA